MPTLESKTKSSIVPYPPPKRERKLPAVDTRVLTEFPRLLGTDRLTGGRAASYTEEGSMAYQVLSGLKQPFLLLKGRAGRGCALDSTRRGNRRAAYTYTPCGAVTATGNVTQPIPWSSQYDDTELGLVYDNDRLDSPADAIPVKNPRTREVVGRGECNLHTGSASNGCVTVSTEIAPWEKNYPQSKDYDKLSQFIAKAGEPRFVSPRKATDTYMGIMYVRKCLKDCEKKALNMH